MERWTIRRLLQGYRKKEFSPVEITSAFLDRIKQMNKDYNAFLTVTADHALHQAGIAEQKYVAGGYIGALEGIPLSIKDLIATKGIRTTSGSSIYTEHVPTKNAAVVDLLEREGAVSLGKTNLDEFALGTTGENPFFGTIRNPWNEGYSVGGSSGGSSVAALSHLGLGSIGTDTGGSIRMPSALTGTFGLKPTYRSVSTSGVTAIAWSLDHVGPITNNASDLISLTEALLEKSYQIEEANNDLRGVRIGVPATYFNEQAEDEVLALYQQALRQMEAAGARLVEVALPLSKRDVDHVFVIEKAEGAYVHRDDMEYSLSQYSDNVKDFLTSSLSISSFMYIEALKRREEIREAVNTALRDVDMLATPTLPMSSVKLGTTEVEIGEKESIFEAMIRYTSIFNMSGHPALSMPGGLTSSGLPFGLQLVGRYHEERRLLQTAAAFEKEYLQDFHKKRESLITV